MRCFGVGEGNVNLGEGSAVGRKVEEDLDALLLDDGNVEQDGKVVWLKIAGLRKSRAGQHRGRTRHQAANSRLERS